MQSGREFRTLLHRVFAVEKISKVDAAQVSDTTMLGYAELLTK
jgi:hypothetical protein